MAVFEYLHLHVASRNYVSQETAQATNLSYAYEDTFIMKADDQTVLTPTGPGRDAIRITSIGVYDTHVTVYASAFYQQHRLPYLPSFTDLTSPTCLKDSRAPFSSSFIHPTTRSCLSEQNLAGCVGGEPFPVLS